MGYYRLSIIHADYGTDSKSLYRNEILINKIRKFQGAGVQSSLTVVATETGAEIQHLIF